MRAPVRHKNRPARTPPSSTLVSIVCSKFAADVKLCETVAWQLRAVVTDMPPPGALPTLSKMAPMTWNEDARLGPALPNQMRSRSPGTRHHHDVVRHGARVLRAWPAEAGKTGPRPLARPLSLLCAAPIPRWCNCAAPSLSRAAACITTARHHLPLAWSATSRAFSVMDPSAPLNTT